MPTSGLQIHHVTTAITTHGKGTYEFTHEVQRAVSDAGLKTGTATVFCRHTSCSLVIMENADATARQDLEAFMERLVPEDQPYFVHTHEGPDDMPSHIKMALTRTSEVVPFDGGRLCLGTWQGIYLWEHRAARHRRELVIQIQGI